MFNSGKAIILGMFLLALAMAAASLWYHRQVSQQALAYLTPEAAQLVAHAPRVELLTLAPQATPAAPVEVVTILGEPHPIVEEREISNAAGLAHARHALLEDASYDWTLDEERCQAQWTRALRFSDEGRSVTLAFDFRCEKMVLAGRSDTAAIAPIAAAMESFFAAQQ